MFLVEYLVIVLVGYLLGSIPSGYLVGRVVGVDVRKVGSGRTGGTNVWRAAGVWAALFTVLGDMLKGAVAIWFAMLIMPDNYFAHSLAGAAAVAGHNWSIFLGFKGGAGSMTSLAGLAVFSLPAALIVSVLAIITLIIWRYASVGSLTLVAMIVLALVALTIWWQHPAEHILYGVLTSAMTVYSLCPNIQRLRAGTERRIGKRPE